MSEARSQTIAVTPMLMAIVCRVMDSRQPRIPRTITTMTASTASPRRTHASRLCARPESFVDGRHEQPAKSVLRPRDLLPGRGEPLSESTAEQRQETTFVTASPAIDLLEMATCAGGTGVVLARRSFEHVDGNARSRGGPTP